MLFVFCNQSSSIIDRYMPKHMRQKVRPEDIARKHRDHSELSEQECNEAYMSFIHQWPLYGSTIFDVLQGYSTILPKNLWLAVNQYGVHILKRREKEPLVSYEYKDIVNYRYKHDDFRHWIESISQTNGLYIPPHAHKPI